MAEAASLTILPMPGHRDDGNPHGRRYSTAEVEAAYLAWKTVHGRSLRRTAEKSDISPSTVLRWAEQGKWRERAAKEDAEDFAGAAASYRARLLPVIDKGIARLEEIIDDKGASATAVVKAVELVANMAGVGPASRPAPLPEPEPDGKKAVRVADLRALSPDQLAHYRDTGEMPEPAPA